MLIDFAHIELLPQNSTQPAMDPTCHVWHTAVDGQATTDLYGWFASANAKGAESHTFIAGSGNLIQMMNTNVRADAQFAGNGYAVSTETHDGGDPRIPWNQAQIATGIALSRWLWVHHRIEPRVMTHEHDRAHGWHSLFPDWNKDRHDCPGSVRVSQIAPMLAQVLKPSTPGGPLMFATCMLKGGGMAWFHLRADGSVSWRFQQRDHGYAWTGEALLAKPASLEPTMGIAAGVNADGRLEVFGQVGGQPVHAWQDPAHNNAWTDFVSTF